MFVKINIVNPNSLDLGEAFGISLRRRDEIAKQLDKMADTASTEQMRYVYLWQIIKEIEGGCNTQEEFIWALLNHIQWLAKRGHLLIPL